MEDPVRYWQELTENYAQMSGGELLELADKPEDLTEVAQQVLRDEMKRRGLSPSGESGESTESQRVHVDRPATVNVEPFSYRHAEWQDPNQTEGLHEYTWKTPLAECASRREAHHLAEFLRMAGIESWISLVDPGWISGGARVQVAADQLEHARLALGTYVPPEPSTEVEQQVPEFVLPACPQCSSKEDAMLQNSDPVNAWLCEACGAEWTDPEPAPDENAETPKSSAR